MDIKVDESEKILINKSYELSERLTRIEAWQSDFGDHLRAFSEEIHAEIRGSVTDRITDMSKLIAAQQQVQSDIVRIQSKQGEQIESIRYTLDKFANLEQAIESHESRIKALEKTKQAELDLKKERIKGVWAAVGGVIAAIASIATVLITTL